jgi:hypothetical protein
MASWYDPTMKPRIHFGAVSDWYRGTGILISREGHDLITFGYVLSAEIKPTPNPAKNLPARNNGMEVAAVCKITPKLNTQLEAIKPHRRPMVSPSAAAQRAPKNVPADRMETIAEDWLEVTLRCPVASL